MRSLILIDSYAQIFRGYFAVRVLNSHDGTPTNAVFAMAKFLLKLNADYPVDAFDGAFVFDLGKPAHRLELAPDYKANRPPAPPDLTAQIPIVRDLIRAFGWPLFEQQAWEADDLISALANAFPEREIRIISADKDLAQLINERVAMLIPSRTGTGFELRDEAAVLEKFGVPPSGIIDYLALVDDAGRHHRLPRARRRHGGQHPRHRGRRTEDRGQTYFRVRFHRRHPCQPCRGGQ